MCFMSHLSSIAHLSVTLLRDDFLRTRSRLLGVWLVEEVPALHKLVRRDDSHRTVDAGSIERHPLDRACCLLPLRALLSRAQMDA